MWSLIIHMEDGPILYGARWKGEEMLMPGCPKMKDIILWCRMTNIDIEIGWPYEGRPVFWFGNPKNAERLIEAWS